MDVRAGTQKQRHGQRGKTNNLSQRLDQHQNPVLPFMEDFRVPLPIIQAAQELRMIKGRQHIAGIFWSLTVAEALCRFDSDIATRKTQTPSYGSLSHRPMTAIAVGLS